MHGMDMPHSGHGDMDMGPKCKMNVSRRDEHLLAPNRAP